MSVRLDERTLRGLRIGSGLVLFAYVITHFLNHAVGLVSLPALTATGEVFRAVWRSPPVNALLYGAFLLHLVLVLRALWRRRGFRIGRAEAAQILLGLAIPPLIVLHAVGTGGAATVWGIEPSYPYVLIAIWIDDPRYAVLNSAALVVAWAHGCIGLHLWLRLRAWYDRAKGGLLMAAVLLPTVALSGFLSAAREVTRLHDNVGWRTRFYSELGWPGPEATRWVYDTTETLLLAYGGLLCVLIAARAIRALADTRRRRLVVRYGGGRTVRVPAGHTILEASRIAGVPHAGVCGGRGRCSTCRVRVLRSSDPLPPPDAGEAAVLHRIGADTDVRLACQLRPRGEVSVLPLLPPDATPRDAWSGGPRGDGVERVLTVLFADLRGFTSLAETRLPYDVVFLINAFAAATGAAIEREGGHIDKFIGDGVMALFGIDGTPEEGARSAVRAVQAMAEALDALNARLGDTLPQPLRMGIGLHNGPVVLGRMGYGRARALTAVGDTVNIASRLEALTKELAAEVVLSSEVAASAGIAGTGSHEHSIEVRGRSAPMRVLAWDRAADVPRPDDARRDTRASPFRRTG